MNFFLFSLLSVSSDCIERLIETIGCFGTQTKEPNISFTSISNDPVFVFFKLQKIVLCCE